MGQVFYDVDIYHPTQSLAHAGSMQSLQCLMSRATGPESVRAGKEVLLIHRLQHHDDRPLCHLVLEGRDAERPSRAIRLRDICPANRWRFVATRLDAIQE